MLDEANERTEAKKEEADSLEGMSIMAPTIQRELYGRRWFVFRCGIR